MNVPLPVESFLQQATIPLRLSACTPSGWPIVLSLWYLFEDGRFFCATPQKARVVTYLSADSRCGFEVASDLPPYCGVRGPALARIDEESGVQVLTKLLHRYLGGIDNPLAQDLLNRQVPEVAITLEPQDFHVWNFTKRMRGSFPQISEKLCPDVR